MTDRSALCIATPPDITGTGDDEIEWFVRVGPRGAHRRLQPGDHLGLDHTLVQLFPDHFDTSPELANTICLSRPTAEVLTAREHERRRLMPRYVQIIRWRCENCGFELDGEAIIPPAVQALDVASALDAAEDPEQRARIQYWSVTQQQRRLDALTRNKRCSISFAAHTCNVIPAASCIRFPTCPNATHPNRYRFGVDRSASANNGQEG